MRPKVVMSFSMSFQPYQGRYLRVYNQATTLVGDGYDVELLSWDREAKWPEREERDGIHILRFPIAAPIGQGPHRNLFNVLRFNWKVFRRLMNSEFDVAHCYNLDTIISTLAAAKLRGRKCVLDLCEPEYYAFWDKRFSPLLKLVNFIEAALARRYDHVLVHNEFQVNKFKERGIDHVSRVGSYPNLYMVPEGEEGRDRTDDSTVVIGRIGTIYENNGIEELIEAFRLLLDRQKNNPDPVKYRLLLAGRVYDSYQQTLDALVAPLRDHIDLSGPFQSTELHRIYRNVDISIIFVRKTKWFQHITPTKLFDSMANGVPVVGNDIGEVKQIVEEGPCGIIVDETDPESICDGIEQIARDTGLRREMGNAGRTLAKEKYTWEVFRDRFLEVYGSLVGK